MENPDVRDLARRIHDGSYFTEGRKWYSEIYLSPISERFFYLVLTFIAVLTSFIALLAVLRLLPITPATPFMIYSDDVIHNLPIIKALSSDRSEPTNDALRRFFVQKYVEYREGYAHEKIAERARVLYHWTAPEVFEIYRRFMDTENPRSPVVLYESSAERRITVVSSSISEKADARGTSYIANADFVAYVIKPTSVESSTWKVEMTFRYKNAEVEQLEVDEKTGRMKVSPMEFIVTEYITKESGTAAQP